MDFVNNKTSLTTGIKELRNISLLICITSIIVSMSKLIHLLNNKNLWMLLNIHQVIIAAIVTIVSLIIMRLFFDFSNGFSGPPLVRNMLIQSLSTPFKPMVAHLIYFGPFFIFTYRFIIKNKESKIPFALSVIAFTYMPILFLGSESRQWIMVLPPIIFSGLFIPFGRVTKMIICIFTLFTLLPAVLLKNSIIQAIKFNDGYQDNTWQVYFAYQGPWMNTDIYKAGLIFMVVFLLAIFWA